MPTPELTLLAVDDHPDNLISLQALLEDALPAARLLTATSGLKALELAAAEDPDAILLDVVMPEMDGFEVCRRLKADARTRDIPVVFLTALRADREHRVRALEEGAEAFLSKPVDELELTVQVCAMAKIKAAAVSKREQTKGLEALVAERTREIEQGRVAALNLLEDLRVEQEERKHAEERLKASKEYLDRIINAIGDPVFVKDDQFKFVLANDALCVLLGRTREEIIATTGLDYLPADQMDHFLEVDRKVLSSGAENLCRESLTAYDGKVRTIVTKKTRYVDGHGARFIVGAIRDVTQQEHLEEQLRMSQKMEAIGSLAGGVAHDFNNLLSVILGNTAFAMEALREADPIRGDLVEVKQAAERAVALTRQLLAFSRKQTLQPVPLNLNQIAAGVEKMLRRIVGEDLDYVQVLAPDLGLVLADPGQIEQVLMNLVVNARDAMPAGGKLTIETANVEFDEEYAARHVAVTPGAYVRLAVTDTGCGMDEKTKARLFEPFFTTKQKGKGTGLGLSTVYGIVKQSGGNIWVYSELGLGTTFKIYLPRELDAAATVPQTEHVVTRATGTETVLVVDDEEALRRVAQRSLTAAGFTVLTAAGGAEALESAAQHPAEIQLLLTDVVMPKMSGRALALELAKTRPAIKVLYMSGYTDNAIVHHGVLDEGTQFLGKPFTGAELARKVREVLDGSSIRGR